MHNRSQAALCSGTPPLWVTQPGLRVECKAATPMLAKGITLP